MAKKYGWPAIIMLALVLAMTFRYHIEATKTTDKTVLKWELDRWTGRLWLKTYGGTTRTSVVDAGNHPWRHFWEIYQNGALDTYVGEQERAAYTYIWLALVAFDGAWFWWIWRSMCIDSASSAQPTP